MKDKWLITYSMDRKDRDLMGLGQSHFKLTVLFDGSLEEFFTSASESFHIVVHFAIKL